MADFDLSFLAQPTVLLPIARYKRNLQYAIEKYSVVVIIGETGSGKTTQIPQYLYEAGWCRDGKMIAVTQPRRVAAMTIASRVASEMRCQVGEEVGYSVRFEDATSEKTRIKFLTDVIMVDEAHERSLSSDLLLGLLKKIQAVRPELRVVVSSATIESQKIADFFKKDDNSQDCKIIAVGGCSFPVDVLYSENPCEDYVSSATDTAIRIHKQEGPGDILIFLTGRDDIQKALEILSDYSGTILPNAQALQPLPLYAGLGQSEQVYVFSPPAENTRKVILSTNVAEASVTIDGIVFVIDCGFVKLRSYNFITNIETLTKVPVSQASAIQRAGRAGRTRPGKCYRLFPARTFDVLPRVSPPEIQRTNLAAVILQLKALGVDNVAAFPFLTPPPAKLMARGLEVLFSLGALDDYAKLTKPLGSRMAELALPPMMSRALLASTDPEFNCPSEMLSIAAMTSVQSADGGSIWFDHDGRRRDMETSRRKFAAEEGDHLTYLNVYQAFVTRGKQDSRWCQQNNLKFKTLARAVSIRTQLKRNIERLGIKISDEPLISGSPETVAMSTEIANRILRCLISGYFANVARMNQADGTFRPLVPSTQQTIKMYAHPTSLMFNRKVDYIVFHDLLETGDKIYLKDISKIEKSWILEFGRNFYQVSRSN